MMADEFVKEYESAIRNGSFTISGYDGGWWGTRTITAFKTGVLIVLTIEQRGLALISIHQSFNDTVIKNQCLFDYSQLDVEFFNHEYILTKINQMMQQNHSVQTISAVR